MGNEKKSITIGLSSIDAEIVDVDYKDSDLAFINDIREVSHLVNLKTDMNVLLFCRKGKVRFVVNDKQIEAHEQQLVILQSGVMINDFMISPDFQSYIVCMTDRLVKGQLHTHINIWNQALYVNHMNILQIPDAAHNEIADKKMSEVLVYYMMRPRRYFHEEIIASLVRCMLLDVCALIQEQLPFQRPMAHTQGERLFNRFLQLLADDPVKRHTVEYYARQLCVSPKYLSSVCRQSSNRTALQWINEYTMNDISYYLRNSGLSIKEVSVKLGFPNLSFFGKFVRQHFGMSPREFRNQSVRRTSPSSPSTT